MISRGANWRPTGRLRSALGTHVTTCGTLLSAHSALFPNDADNTSQRNINDPETLGGSSWLEPPRTYKRITGCVRMYACMYTYKHANQHAHTQSPATSMHPQRMHARARTHTTHTKHTHYNEQCLAPPTDSLATCHRRP